MVKCCWDIDVKLVNKIKKHKALYDVRCPAYQKLSTRCKSWELVANELGLPLTECKTRWRNLCDVYIKKIRTGDKKWNCGNPDWDYMSLMSFLAKHTKSEAIINGTPRPKKRRKANKKDKKKPVIVESQNESSDNTDEDEENNSEETHNGETPKKNGLVSAKKVARTESNEDNASSTLNNTLIGNITKSPTHKFFEAIADFVDKLPPQLQAQVRLKVCHIVTEVEIKHYGHEQESRDSLF